MSDPLATDHLSLPYLAPAQAQKHVTHNEALKRLDAVVQLAVKDASRTSPPGSPAEGDRHIVAASPTGAWTGKDHQVASFVDGAWQFFAGEPGWLAFDVATGAILVRETGGWADIAGHLGDFDRLGVNATADTTNRLAVRSAAVLFSAIAAADGGSGDIRFVVNKETAGDTASLLFQTNWSGRAEVGLAGDDDLVLKVSPDGSTWHEAIRLDKDTGLSTIPYDNGASGLTAATVQAAIDEVAAGIATGAVTSVFGRTGAIAAAARDYDASQVDNDSSVSGATVKDALNTLATSVSGKQDADADLTALAGNATNGLWARTGSGAGAARTVTGPAAGIAVSNGDGVSGNPTLALANDLAALEGLSSTGFAVRTATDSWAQRSLAAPAAGITIGNNTGVSGNPTLALANDLAALEGLASTGLAVRSATDTWLQRSVGAGSGLVVANGDGVAGNPTVSFDAPEAARSAIDAAHVSALAANGLQINGAMQVSLENIDTAVTGIGSSGGADTYVTDQFKIRAKGSLRVSGQRIGSISLAGFGYAPHDHHHHAIVARLGRLPRRRAANRGIARRQARLRRSGRARRGGRRVGARLAHRDLRRLSRQLGPQSLAADALHDRRGEHLGVQDPPLRRRHGRHVVGRHRRRPPPRHRARRRVRPAGHGRHLDRFRGDDHLGADQPGGDRQRHLRHDGCLRAAARQRRHGQSALLGHRPALAARLRRGGARL